MAANDVQLGEDVNTNQEGVVVPGIVVNVCVRFKIFYPWYRAKTGVNVLRPLSFQSRFRRRKLATS